MQDVNQYYHKYMAQAALLSTQSITSKEADLLFYRGIPIGFSKAEIADHVSFAKPEQQEAMYESVGSDGDHDEEMPSKVSACKESELIFDECTSTGILV